MPYTPELADLWINSTRGALQYKDGASPHSKTITPSANWFTAGQTLAKGNVVSIVDEQWNLESGNTLGRVYKTDTQYVNKSLGLVLRPSTAGNPVEVQRLGRFYFDSAVFNASDIGKKVYAHPTDGSLTTDRNTASQASNIIEIGIIVDTDQLDLNIENDKRDFVDTTIFEYQLDAQVILPVTEVGGDTAYIAPKIFAINPSTGKLVLANRATTNVQYYQIAGIMIGTDASNNYTGGNWTIPADTRVLVQRGGTLTRIRIKDASGGNYAIYLQVNTSALLPGDGLFLDDTDGLYTNSEPSIVYDGDSYVEMGFVKSVGTYDGEIILRVHGPYVYRADNPFPIGAIINQPGASPDYGFLTCDGGAYSTVDYADLYDVIGDTWGTVLEAQSFDVTAGVGSVLEVQNFTITAGVGSVLEQQSFTVTGGVPSVYEIQSFDITAGVGSVLEVQSFTVTGEPTSDGDITVDGETIAILDADTTDQVAQKIRDHAFTNWDTSGSGSNVILTAKTYGDKALVVVSAGTTGATFSAVSEDTAGTSLQGNITVDGETIAVADGDDASAVATKVRAHSFTNWNTSGAGTEVILTAKTYGDKALVVCTDTDATGVTFSVVTEDTPGFSGAGNLTVDGENIAVADGDTASDVAGKIRAHGFTNWVAGGSGANVTLEALTYGDKADVVLNALSTGVTFSAVSEDVKGTSLAGNITIDGETIAVADGDGTFEVGGKIRAHSFTNWTTGGADDLVVLTAKTYGDKADVVCTDTDGTGVTFSAITESTKGTSLAGDVTVDGENIAVADGDDINAVATKIRAHSFTDWTTSGAGAEVILTAKTVGDKPTIVVSGGTTGVTFSAVSEDTPGSFYVPNLNNGNKFQIRYSSYYVGNPQLGLNPVHRYRTEFASYTGFSDTETLDLTALFSSPWDVRELVVVLTMRQTSTPLNMINIYPGIINQAYYEGGVTFQRQTFNYEVKSDPADSNQIIVNIGKNGIAYYNESGDAIGGDPEDPTFHPYTAFPTDGSWQFSWTIYKAEQWNRFIDPEQDLRLQSLWQLGFIDLKSSTNLNPENNQEDGHFDRTTTNPVDAHTTRLNYDGNLYVSGLFISQDTFQVNKTRTTAYSSIQLLGGTANVGTIRHDDGVGFSFKSSSNGTLQDSFACKLLLDSGNTFEEYPSIDNGYIEYRGGASTVDNPWVRLYGKNHSTQPGKLYLRGGAGGIDIKVLGGGGIGNITLEAGSTSGQVMMYAAAGSLVLNASGSLTYNGGTAGNLTLTAGSTSGTVDITSSGTLTITGGSATSANRPRFIMTSKSLNIYGNSDADGSDNSSIALRGGGGTGTGRGAQIIVYGNESLSGKIQIVSGSAGGDIDLQNGHANASVKIISTYMKYSPSSQVFYLQADTTDGSDDAILYLCGGGANSNTRGASLILSGNEGNNGDATLEAGNSGTLEVQSFTVTGEPTADGDITVDGETIAILDADTTDGVATKIRAHSFTNWTTSGSDSNVILTAKNYGNKSLIVVNAGTTGATFSAVSEDTAGINTGILYLKVGGATQLTISVNDTTYESTFSGDVQAVSFNSTSSIALKKDIVPFIGNALELINKTGIFSYKFKRDTGVKNERIGIIAEYTDPLLSGKDQKSFDHSNALALALKAIQELSAEVEKLKSQSIIRRFANFVKHIFKR